MKIKKIIKWLSIIIISLILVVIINEIYTSNKTYYKSEKNLKIPIFVYHDIVDGKDKVSYDYMQTTKETFENQISSMKKIGYHAISYQDLVDYNQGKKPIYKHSFLVTFDDGFRGVYENAFSVIKQYKLPVNIFIINSKMEEENYLTWQQAKEMQESGLVNISSHSTNHIKYDKTTVEVLEKDVQQSFKEIEEKVGKHQLKIFCYPYGLHSKEGKNKLKELKIIENLTDNKINRSNTLDLYGLHRMYPLNDSIFKIILKIEYRSIKYK